jgi:hypothetical protein
MNARVPRHALRELDVPRPKAPMPLVGESLAPWVAASCLLGLVTVSLFLGGERLPVFEKAMLFTGLFATLTACALVVVRADRELADSDREERDRPATEALQALDAPLGTAAYVAGMQRWTDAMLELIQHAIEHSDEDTAATNELVAAAADTADLRALLAEGQDDQLTINDLAVIHALCTLWEANQPWVEELAAAADDGWHARWAARHVADRRLRHGVAAPEPLLLPYRA